jgi:Zn finger protein HypA/HybF involved in hydrogenase expression
MVSLMHELSIVMSIAEMAEEDASVRNARVTAVHLKLGFLPGVAKQACCPATATPATARRRKDHNS